MGNFGKYGTKLKPLIFLAVSMSYFSDMTDLGPLSGPLRYQPNRVTMGTLLFDLWRYEHTICRSRITTTKSKVVCLLGLVQRLLIHRKNNDTTCLRWCLLFFFVLTCDFVTLHIQNTDTQIIF